MPLARVKNLTRENWVADRAQVANTSATRRTGLLKHTALAEGEGLWIVPCEGVHTIGMRFVIDVVFLDKKRKVVKIRSRMGRWRFALALRAHSVLELPEGAAAQSGLAVGDQLAIEKY